MHWTQHLPSQRKMRGVEKLSVVLPSSHKLLNAALLSVYKGNILS